jgi:hypothetical protein
MGAVLSCAGVDGKVSAVEKSVDTKFHLRKRNGLYHHLAGQEQRLWERMVNS